MKIPDFRHYCQLTNKADFAIILGVTARVLWAIRLQHPSFFGKDEEIIF